MEIEELGGKTPLPGLRLRPDFATGDPGLKLLSYPPRAYRNSSCTVAWIERKSPDVESFSPENGLDGG